jgi:ADP-ribose pyrophosphatase YjhB (NUDIX family)
LKGIVAGGKTKRHASRGYTANFPKDSTRSDSHIRFAKVATFGNIGFVKNFIKRYFQFFPNRDLFPKKNFVTLKAQPEFCVENKDNYFKPPMRYCPHCATRLEKTQKTQREHLACPVCGFVDWNHPIPAAGCLIENGGHLLLIRRQTGAHAGEWSLPIGFMQFGETAEQAAGRAVVEATGLQVEAASLIGAYSDIINDQRSHLVLVFRGRILGGTLRTGEGAPEAAWFSEHELPVIAFVSDRNAIAAWRAERSGPPTAYYFCPRCRSSSSAGKSATASILLARLAIGFIGSIRRR